MAEVKSDTTNVELNEKKDGVIVTRTIIEEFDAEEYLKRISQLEYSAEERELSAKELRDMIERFATRRQPMEIINKENLKKAAKEREKAGVMKLG